MLMALEPYNATIESLRPYSSRPACWFPLDRRLSHLWHSQSGAVINQLMRLVRLRASAELAANRPEAAFENVRLVLRLADYGRQRPKPGSIAHSSHLLAVVDALQPIWEGLTQRAWTAGQIAELQRQLAGLDFLNDFDDSVRADALTTAAFVELMIPTTSSGPAQEIFAGADDQSALDLTRLVCPVGWSLMDQASIHRFHLEFTSHYLDLSARRIVGERNIVGEHKSDRSACKWPGLFGSSDPLFRIYITPLLKTGYTEAFDRFPFAQTVVDLATLACALERYRLANGEFPATLDSLAPQFLTQLPHDIINGEPLKVPAHGRWRVCALLGRFQPNGRRWPAVRAGAPLEWPVETQARPWPKRLGVELPCGGQCNEAVGQA